MTDKRHTSADLFPGSGAPGSSRVELTQEVIGLLEEFARSAAVLSPGDLLDSRFRESRPDLHYRLRVAFSSYNLALATLAWYLSEPELSREILIERVRDHYRSGEILDDSYFLARDPMLGRKLIAVFGNLAQALSEAEIPLDLARVCRRLEPEVLLRRALQTQAATGARTATRWREHDRLMMEAASLRFSTHAAFLDWIDEHSRRLPAVFGVWARRSVARWLVDELDTVGRGGRGRELAPTRFEAARVLWGGSDVLAVSASGVVYRIPDGMVPLRPSELDYKVGLDRKDRLITLVQIPGEHDMLAFLSAFGRVKLVPADTFRRFRAEGVRGMGLEEGDSVVQVCRFVPGRGDLVLFTSGGRALRVGEELLRTSSRHSRGVLWLRLDNPQDQAVELFQAGEGDEYMVLGKRGFVRRGPVSELPQPKNRAAGVLVARDQVVAAALVRGERMGVMTRQGRLLLFPSSSVRVTSRYSRGVTAIRLARNDKPMSLFSGLEPFTD